MAFSGWTVQEDQVEAVELHRPDFGDPAAFDAIVEAYKDGSTVWGGGSPEVITLSIEHGSTIEDMQAAALAAQAGGVWTLDDMAKSLLGIEEG